MNTFTEKIQHRMKYDRDPRLIIASDKILFRFYVEHKLPGVNLFQHRLYNGYDRDAAVKAVQKNTCIKISNGWHKYRFIFDTPDPVKINAAIDGWLNAPAKLAEWGYNYTRTGFTVEKIINPVNTVIKVFCFHGRAEYVWFQTYDIRKGDVNCTLSTLYNRDLKKLNAPWGKRPDPDYKIPKRINDIIAYSEKIASDWDHLRVDLFYNYDDDKIYLSELVPYTGAGTTGFPDSINAAMGAKWKI
jgi:hypothetical protein